MPPAPVSGSPFYDVIVNIDAQLYLIGNVGNSVLSNGLMLTAETSW